MPKYQFFTFPYNQKTDFTYLEMDTETFLEEKEGLLEQEFEVDGEPIYADNAEAAVEKYQSRFSRTVEDYNKSFLSYILIEGLIALWKRVRNK